MFPLRYFHSENVVFGENVQEAGIFVDEYGKISKIVVGEALKNVQLEENIQIHDMGKLFIMAGLVDSHVHVNEPGRTAWEGYETATRAAAAGGITTIVDMPLNSMPPTTTVDNFKTKINATQNKIHVDVAFWGGVVPGNENELQPLIKAGVVGFKCFLCNTGIDDFTHVNAEQVKTALEKLRTTNSVLAFHAEMDEDVSSNGDPKKYATFLKSRPPTMEINAIKLVASLCEKYNVRCHIVHLSAADALPFIRETKKKTNKLTVETCHHYLWFEAETIPDEGTQYKCTPPIRSSSNRETLWQALKDDDIDLVVSDHSPCTPDLKYLLKSDNKTEGDFLKAWGGISSVQFGLSLFWTQARQRNFEIKNITKYLSKRPAELCGLNNKKGEIAVGKDADFVIWDPNLTFTINEDIIHHKNKVTPYMGKQLYGKVFYTVLRGNIIYETNKEFKTPQGKLLISGGL